MLRFIAGALALALHACEPAYAHQAPSGMRYDGWCCSPAGDPDNAHGDCAPIPDRSVRITPQGYVVTVGRGDHPMVTAPHQWTRRPDETRQSTDGRYHLCLYPTEADARCLYVPPMGY